MRWGFRVAVRSFPTERPQLNFPKLLRILLAFPPADTRVCTAEFVLRNGKTVTVEFHGAEDNKFTPRSQTRRTLASSPPRFRERTSMHCNQTKLKVFASSDSPACLLQTFSRLHLSGFIK